MDNRVIFSESVWIEYSKKPPGGNSRSSKYLGGYGCYEVQPKMGMGENYRVTSCRRDLSDLDSYWGQSLVPIIKKEGSLGRCVNTPTQIFI